MATLTKGFMAEALAKLNWKDIVMPAFPDFGKFHVGGVVEPGRRDVGSHVFIMPHKRKRIVSPDMAQMLDDIERAEPSRKHVTITVTSKRIVDIVTIDSKDLARITQEASERIRRELDARFFGMTRR